MNRVQKVTQPILGIVVFFGPHPDAQPYKEGRRRAPSPKTFGGLCGR